MKTKKSTLKEKVIVAIIAISIFGGLAAVMITMALRHGHYISLGF